MAFTYISGTGTQASPYAISNENGLNELKTWINAGNASAGLFFILTNNITLTANWTTTIGNLSTRAFKGTLDGQGFLISTITYSGGKDYYGLFGHIDSATIIDLRINLNININVGVYMGGLAGSAINSTIKRCSASGTFAGTRSTGGLIGIADTVQLIGCSNSATISAGGTSQGQGGLVGEPRSCSFIGCYVTGSVTGTEKVGGISPQLGGSNTFEKCYIQGNVSASATNAEWTSGLGIATKTDCYVLGNVSCPNGNNYNLIYGVGYGDATRCYLSGSLTGGSSCLSFPIGASSTCTDCYYDSSKSFTNIQPQSGATGLTTAQFATAANFANWDFTNTWVMVSSFPRLRATLLTTAPTLSITSQTATEISLSWTASTYATSYRVYNGFELLTEVSSTNTTINLTPNTSYRLRVKATNSTVESTTSNIITLTTPSAVLYFQASDTTYSISLYSTAQTTPSLVIKNADGTHYAKLGVTTDPAASRLRTHYNNQTYAVLTS